MKKYNILSFLMLWEYFNFNFLISFIKILVYTLLQHFYLKISSFNCFSGIILRTGLDCDMHVFGYWRNLKWVPQIYSHCFLICLLFNKNLNKKSMWSRNAICFLVFQVKRKTILLLKLFCFNYYEWFNGI